ncbi:MAG: hypothetical protein RLZZ627_2047 [Pseudomonadota bacterium]|jgi:hypothetical protein
MRATIPSLVLGSLVLLSLPALADGWQSVGDTEDGSSFYLEMSSLKKTAKGGQIWTMTSLPVPKDGYSSLKTLFEFDCKSHKHHIIDMAFYSETMGNGNQVKNILIPKTVWVATDPNSTEGAYMEVACDALRAPK